MGDIKGLSYVQNEIDCPNELFHISNIAIAMSYFAVGFVGSFISTPLNVYLISELNAEPSMQNTIGILQSLPWSLKLVFGFLSDALPLGGMHRKPYLTIGALVYSASFMVYSILEFHNVVFLAVCVFIGTLGLIQLDVMADTMCVERSRFEPEESKGQMQASCYSIRFAGSLLGAICGASVSNQDIWGWGLSFSQVAFVNGTIPFLLVTPWLYFLREKYVKKGLKINTGGVVGMKRGQSESGNGSSKVSNSKSRVRNAHKLIPSVDNYSAVSDMTIPSTVKTTRLDLGNCETTSANQLNQWGPSWPLSSVNAPPTTTSSPASSLNSEPTESTSLLMPTSNSYPQYQLKQADAITAGAATHGGKSTNVRARASGGPRSPLTQQHLQELQYSSLFHIAGGQVEPSESDVASRGSNDESTELDGLGLVAQQASNHSGSLPHPTPRRTGKQAHAREGKAGRVTETQLVTVDGNSSAVATGRNRCRQSNNNVAAGEGDVNRSAIGLTIDGNYDASIEEAGSKGASYQQAGADADRQDEVGEDAVSDGTISISAQLHEIWETVQLQAVWRPMAFVYIYNIFQVPNIAWQSFLQLSLHFEPWILGATVILGSFMTFAGILAYKYFFFKASWRSIYVWSTCLTSFFALMQLVLIFQINVKYLHLSNYFFSMGDDVITAYISGIQFLPVCIMYMRLCPDGAEGASYSMLTTFGNIALVCASNIGSHFTGIWDVSNDAMRAHDVSGLWRLTLLTSTLSLVPLSLLHLLPASAEEQDQLSKSKSRSPLGGAIFLLVLFASLSWTISSAVTHLWASWSA